MFVNIVSSEKVERPTSKEMKGGRQWSVPHSVGPLRMETDKSESLVPTLDVCFHPTALEMGSRAVQFHNLLVDTAREGVTNGFKRMKDDVIIDAQYHVIKGVQYKNGEPAVMILGKAKKAPALAKAAAAVTNANANAKANAKANANANEGQPKSEPKSEPAVKKGFMTATKTTRKKGEGGANASASTSTSTGTSTKTGGGGKRGGGEDANGNDVPVYTISEVGEFNISEHTLENSTEKSVNATRPKSLVIRIELPSAAKASELDLDVSDYKLALKSVPDNKSKHNYAMDVRFSYPVIGDDGSAKWDKVKKILTVTVPVVAAEGEELGSKRIQEVEVVAGAGAGAGAGAEVAKDTFKEMEEEESKTANGKKKKKNNHKADNSNEPPPPPPPPPPRPPRMHTPGG